MENGRHVLLDGGTPIGAVVNGQRIQQKQLLKDGDMIQLGQVRLLFREKATAAKVGRPIADVPRSAQAPGALAMPSNLCPFCGAQKDANGNCLCTVPGAASPGAPAADRGMSAPPSPESVGMAPAFSGGPGGSTGPLGAPSYAPTPAYGSGAGVFGGMGTGLIALEGPYAGQRFPLSGPQVSIGRSPDNMIALVNDSTVSRRHAHIAEENGHHVLYDDGSSNGTFVNGVRITIQTLAPGDIIHFGAGKFHYE
jgi:pSer/pThr/pTyr-binding forkhead associated (FHA) protein